LTIEYLRDAYDEKISHSVALEMDKYTAEYQGFNARFTEYEKKRMVGFAAQFVALFKRNGLYLLRNSKTV
jgi:hypothetical protein